MRATLAIVIVLLVGCSFAAPAGTEGGPGGGPSTRPVSTRPATPADGWSGEYRRLGGWQLREDEPTRVSILKVGDAYHLRGTHYDDTEFVEEKPGLLWDRGHLLGTISRGSLTFEAPGRLGRADPVTVLDVQFCYDFFYLFGGAGPETTPRTPATRPAQ